MKSIDVCRIALTVLAALALAGCAAVPETPPTPATASSVQPAAGALRDAGVSNLRMIVAAQTAYSAKISNGGAFGSFHDLVAQGHLDKRFDSSSPETGGFTFTLETGPGTFKCVARGLGVNKDKVFAVNQTGTIFSDEACTTPASVDD
ncbi:MAG: hypothetical protein KA419_06635 [Acidobacteria bacterium]|nr:hypothetical protein [Acidobacteriota bacterium]